MGHHDDDALAHSLVDRDERTMPAPLPPGVRVHVYV